MIIDSLPSAGATTAPTTLGPFLDGRVESVDGDGDAFTVIEPATSRTLARVAECGAAGVDRAVASARRAFSAWRATPPRERAALIQELGRRIAERANEIALLDARDTGNPVTAMRNDVAKGVRQLNDAAGLALEMKGETFPLPGLHFTRREPWGVVGRMITFNHPAMFTCARLGSALVAGNCVILKPSELAPLSTLAIAELSAGVLPDGVVSVVTGGPATGEALVRHPDVRRISFTGSTATGLRIQAAAADSGTIKTISLELGGKNPIVVFDDVDHDEVARAIVRGMNFARVQGQSCGSTSRLIIHQAIADDVLSRAGRLAAEIRIGLPTDTDTEMGSMISETARDRCIETVGRAVANGARVVSGGRPPAGTELTAGAFLEPTIVDRVAPASELAREEIFGPVLTAMTFAEEAEAIELANDGRYGLTAAVWTADIDRAFRVADRIDAGYLWINDVETRFPGVPFGGWKDSGVGLEHGLEEILSFTRLKAVNVRLR